MTGAWLRGEVDRLRDPWAAGAVPWLLGGGLMTGIFVPEIRLLGIVAGAVLVAGWLRVLPRGGDALDGAAAVALAMLAVGAAFSTQPRVSVEFAIYGVALVALLALLRRRFADAASRDRLLAVGGRIGVGVAVAVAALWLWEALGWTLDAGPGSVPPLQLDYSDDWFRNLNVLPIYLALLFPAVVHLWSVRGERWLAGAGIAAAGIVTLLSASRAAWIGIAAGALVFAALLGARRLPRPSRATAGWLVAGGVLALAALVLSGIARAVVEGASDFATVDTRLAIWRAALGAWTDHPIIGSGLGTIPAQLLAHGLAAADSGPAPHAHSMPIQLLAEAGIVGAAAIALVAAALVREARRNGAGVPRAVRAAAAAALVAFAVGGLADNHTALGAIATLVVACAALLAPCAAGEPGMPRASRNAWLSGATTVLAAMALATVVTWAGAAIAWGRAQALVLEGRALAAASPLELAAALDPQLPLYTRELGKLRLAAGDGAAARDLLAAAAARNPDDPNAWRTIGVLDLVDGRPAAALPALERSLRLDASQIGSHLLVAIALDRAGRPDEADAVFAAAVLRQPGLLLSDGWSAIGIPPQRLATLAERAWRDGLAAEPRPAERLASLALSLLDADRLEVALAGGVPAADAWRAALAAELGDTATARALLAASASDARNAAGYWSNAVLVDELAADETSLARDLRLAKLLREDRSRLAAEPGLADPVTRDGNDFWMYARATSWITVGVGLRLPTALQGNWLRIHAPDRIELPAAREPRVAPAASAR